MLLHGYTVKHVRLLHGGLTVRDHYKLSIVRKTLKILGKQIYVGIVERSLYLVEYAERHGTKFNGAPYITQKAAMAVYSEEGKAQVQEQVAYYMRNARVIYDSLKDSGYEVYGGVNAPYIWLKTPKGMTSWDFFDYLLEKANVVGTPGSGFGPSGEGYFRLTAFGTYENTAAAIERIRGL